LLLDGADLTLRRPVFAQRHAALLEGEDALVLRHLARPLVHVDLVLRLADLDLAADERCTQT
jgi:hypothetical protein